MGPRRHRLIWSSVAAVLAMSLLVAPSARADAPATIFVSVSGMTGYDNESARVELYQRRPRPGVEPVGDVRRAPDGTFVISNVPPGRYRVFLERQGGGGPSQWYPAEVPYSKAKRVVVSAGSTTFLQMKAVRAGRLSATIYAEQGDRRWGTVSLYDEDGESFGGDETDRGEAANFEVPPGRYYVSFGRDGFEPQEFLGGKTRNRSKLVTVRADRTRTLRLTQKYAKAVAARHRPSLRGPLRVGATINRSKVRWKRTATTAGATASNYWYVDDQLVVAQGQPSYRVTAADVGKKIRVCLEYFPDPFTTGWVCSKASGRVQP